MQQPEGISSSDKKRPSKGNICALVKKKKKRRQDAQRQCSGQERVAGRFATTVSDDATPAETAEEALKRFFAADKILDYYVRAQTVAEYNAPDAYHYDRQPRTAPYSGPGSSGWGGPGSYHAGIGERGAPLVIPGSYYSTGRGGGLGAPWVIDRPVEMVEAEGKWLLHRQAYERAYETLASLDVRTLCNYAILLTDVRRDYSGAGVLYKCALIKDPNDVVALGNCAILLTGLWDDHDGAEALYKRALQQDPNHASTLCNYATLLTEMRCEHGGAEALYKRALDQDPNHASTLYYYACLLSNVQGDHDGAEALYKRALQQDPNDAVTLTNYAILLTDVRGNHDGAEALFKRALQQDPNEVTALTNYAILLADVRGDHGGAEALYKRALQQDPNDIDSLHNYARLLHSARGGHDGAEALYKRALQQDPNHVGALRSYASLLTDVRGDHGGAEALYATLYMCALQQGLSEVATLDDEYGRLGADDGPGWERYTLGLFKGFRFDFEPLNPYHAAVLSGDRGVRCPHRQVRPRRDASHRSWAIRAHLSNLSFDADFLGRCPVYQNFARKFPEYQKRIDAGAIR